LKKHAKKGKLKEGSRGLIMRIVERNVRTGDGTVHSTPLFLPVYEEGNPYIQMGELREAFPCRGIICNAYFLYKNRRIRKKAGAFRIKEHLDFRGLVVTDSGAFQGLSGPLYLSNAKIIRFQQEVGADVISPLDLITPPGDGRKTAETKLSLTLKRIREGIGIADRSILVGVQQGGRFLDLRIRALEELAALPLRYFALGSLVPFLTRNHDILFVGRNILEARKLLPQTAPLHLYGAGDPLELPFFLALGCDVFDSSSYLHYARDNWYMSPYGALPDPDYLSRSGFVCPCPYCRRGPEEVFKEKERLSRHNLSTIYRAVETAGMKSREGGLDQYLDDIVSKHQSLFPESRLEKSWRELAAESANPASS
jgi:7-cyano-7-deazaguanine tRNA-ribosyltransferase